MSLMEEAAWRVYFQNVKSSGNTEFSFLRTWQTRPLGLSMKQECREVVQRCLWPVPVTSPEAAAPPLLASGRGSCQLKAAAVLGWHHRTPRTCGPSETVDVGSGLFDHGKATRWGIGEASQRSTERQGK